MKKNYENYNSRIVLFCIALILLVTPVMAASTDVHVVKYANDGKTILNETTKTYQWIEANLTVYGDEVTNWYLQGPVFSGDRWNPAEDQNLKNWGRNKGTNVKDLCDLVGGMNSGETVKIWDGAFSKTFPYENVYTPDPRQGPMIISWWFNGSYVPSFADGMRLLFLADDNVYGVWDMNQTLPAAYHYFYYDGTFADPFFPTTTGLSVKYVNEIIIYSDDPVPPDTGSIEVTSTPDGAKIFINSVDSGFTTPHTFADQAIGSYDVYVTKDGYVTPLTQTKSVIKGATTSYTFTLSPVPPIVDTLFDGTVILVPGGTFSQVAYNSGASYTINETTPLGALKATGLTYNVTDSRWVLDEVLLLDDLGQYLFKKPNVWYAYVNGVYKDGYKNHPNGLNVIELNNNDQVNFYYAPNKDPNPVNNATALVKITVNIQPDTGSIEVTSTPDGAKIFINSVDSGFTTPHTFADQAIGSYDVYVTKDGYVTPLTQTKSVIKGATTSYTFTLSPVPPIVDTLFDGTVILVPGGTFSQVAYNSGASYTINETTPLGALKATGLTYNVTDSRWVLDEVLLLDDLGQYLFKKPNVWYAYVNGVYKDGYKNHPNGLNVIELNNNDQVNFYYAPNKDPNPVNNATALVKITVNIQPDTGSIEVTSTPDGAKIFINSVDSGFTTPHTFANQAIGSYDVYVTKDGYVTPATQTQSVIKGATTSYTFTLIPVQVVDTLFDGTVTLVPGGTFSQVAYNSGASYTINETTPLGALKATGLTYNVTDKRWQYDQVLLLDDLGQYLYNKPGSWYAYVNGVYKDGYGNHANGLNVIELSNNDQVNFYYAPNKDPNPVVNATAVVKIKVNIGGSQPVDDWTLSLNGAKTTSVTKTYFEQGLACPGSGHQKFWTDTDGNVWGGVPLWVLVSMVDDNPDVGPDHFNFNDSIAAQGYSVKVTSGDGWDTTLSSQNIARNNSILVVNTLNGTPLPLLTQAGKRSWPLHLKGDAVFGGQQVGNITKIELTGLPQPPTEWTLSLEGDVTDTITQSFFIDAIACKHNVTWTDPVSGTVWQGVPLWDLAGAVDDIESSSHYTYNDTRATMGYTIRVSAADGYNATFSSASTAHNDGYIVAYKMNGTALTGSNAPLKLVGPATSSNKQRVGGIVKISLEGLPDQYPAGNWQLKMVGKISDVIPQGEFEYWASCHNATYTDINGNIYTGIPLWRLLGWVDDGIPHGSNGFNDAAAIAGYKVIVKAGDGYAKEFTSQQIGKTNAFIIANTYNGGPIPNDGDHPPYPLRLVGTGATGGNSVGNVVEIQLTDFQTPTEAPKLHIIKYAGDGSTVINETYVDYTFMENNLPVIGDGITAYKFEGLTMNPSNLWDPEETYPGGFKISNVVKGSRVHDLAELVGGMGSGTTITFVASDGFETTLPYSSIYTNPSVQARQGDAIIAWWGDGQYVPKYADGMRLFFTPDGDHVYGHWDMHETLPSQYWRYNFQDGVQYPSSAGLSAKYIDTIKVYSSPESDWTLELDGRDIGGVNYTVSKPFLEEAIACQFGADHKATYTDSKGRVWEGMPLWFFAGFVDDADQHSKDAYNETKAQAGYNILITGKDGYNTTIFSKDIIRSSNYLVANSLNDTHIADSDENWPLRFTGESVNGSMTVKGVSSIKLIRIVVPPAEGQMKVTSTPAGAEIFINGIDTNNVTPYTFTKAPGDYPVYVTLAGYVTPAPVTATVVSSQLTTKDFVLDAVPPADGQLEVTSTPAGAKIFINGIDTNNVTPYTFTKAPGEYSVYVTLSGYVTPATQTKVVTKNAVTTSDFQLNPITTPSITVVSPNGGESWVRGNAYPISWSYTDNAGSSVSIVLLRGDNPVMTIASTTPIGSGGSGSYTWNIPSDKPLGTDYRVRVQSTSQSTVKDLSNNYFSIVADTAAASITVVSPNGGESWVRGNAYPISWSYTDNAGSSVSIVLLRGDNPVMTIASTTPIGSGGSGSYTWNIPSDKPLGTDYRVRVQSTSQSTVKDLSNNYFSIVADTAAASITVVSPNGGESWVRGNAYPITWSYTGSPGSSVSIVLFNGDTQVFTIASSTSTGSSGSGSYTWNIPADKPLGNDYRVSVVSSSQATVEDKSDSYFTIASGTIDPTTATGVSPGIYNAGNWYIDYNGDGQFIPSTGDRYIPYGATGWTQLVGDWNGDGTSEIGIYKDGFWYIDYGGSGVIDANTRYYSFGGAGWTPIVGDWNADKKDEIGVYQDGNWYLDYNGNGAWDTEDKNYGFGTEGWMPVIGKWTGDGISKIGIYNAGNWYIDYNGDGQFIPSTGDRYIPYGATGWTQLVGDWNGDGTSEIGIFKDGLWYIDYGGSGMIDANTRYYSFGGAGWTPIVGDWNADKKDEIGVNNAGNWYLDYDGNGVWSSGDKNYGFGTTGWMPVIGKWT